MIATTICPTYEGVAVYLCRCPCSADDFRKRSDDPLQRLAWDGNA